MLQSITFAPLILSDYLLLCLSLFISALISSSLSRSQALCLKIITVDQLITVSFTKIHSKFEGPECNLLIKATITFTNAKLLHLRSLIRHSIWNEATMMITRILSENQMCVCHPPAFFCLYLCCCHFFPDKIILSPLQINTPSLWPSMTHNGCMTVLLFNGGHTYFKQLFGTRESMNQLFKCIRPLINSKHSPQFETAFNI